MGGDGKVQCNAKMVQSTGYKAFHYQAYCRPNVLVTGSSWYIPKSASTHLSMFHIILWPYHLIKNRICPSISVAPRISSATSPLRNPLGSLGSGTSTLLLWFSPAGRSHHSHFKLLGLLYMQFYSRKVQRLLSLLPYGGKLSWEKTCTSWRMFVEKTFADCSLVLPKMPHPQISWRKLLRISINFELCERFFAWKFPTIQYEAHWWLFSSRWSPSF